MNLVTVTKKLDVQREFVGDNEPSDDTAKSLRFRRNTRQLRSVPLVDVVGEG